jgi:hypothetical protein
MVDAGEAGLLEKLTVARAIVQRAFQRGPRDA